jgi:hypothetical protein
VIKNMTTDLTTLPITALKEALLQMPQVEPVTEHIFHGGMYCRQVFREAGTLVVGKVHKKEHFYMIVMGTVAITTDDGTIEASAPYLFCSKPGTQRAVLSLTDTLTMTIHRADSVTVEDAEDELVESDPDSPFGAGNVLKQSLLEKTQ